MVVMLAIVPAAFLFSRLVDKWNYKEEIKLFKNIATFLNGNFTSNIFSQFYVDSFIGVHEGFPYTIKLTLRPNGFDSDSILPKLIIFFERRTSFNMTVGLRDSTPTHFLIKKVKTGNPEFDKRFIIYSHDVLPVQNYVRNPDVQEHISALFLLGFPLLLIAKNKVRAERSFGKETDLAIELGKTGLTETIRTLAFLAKSLP